MKTSKEFLSGTLTTMILALLRDRGKMYGYEICQTTRKLTNDEINLTEGAIYPALHKLEKKGMIVSTKEKVNGRVRKYYAIPADKKSVINEQIEMLATFANHIQSILKPAK
jgi:DNA-binding PadR family transcriptional regulator